MAAAALSGVIGRGKQAHREALPYYFSISPWIIGPLSFTIGSVIALLLLSYPKCSSGIGFKLPLWLSLENYQTLIHHEIVSKSLQVTAYYTVPSVPLGIIASLSLAVLLDQDVPGPHIFRTIYYLPSGITGVGVAMLWQWILTLQFGTRRKNVSIMDLADSRGDNCPLWGAVVLFSESSPSLQ